MGNSCPSGGRRHSPIAVPTPLKALVEVAVGLRLHVAGSVRATGPSSATSQSAARRLRHGGTRQLTPGAAPRDPEGQRCDEEPGGGVVARKTTRALLWRSAADAGDRPARREPDGRQARRCTGGQRFAWALVIPSAVAHSSAGGPCSPPSTAAPSTASMLTPSPL